jgi:hypothetical protein
MYQHAGQYEQFKQSAIVLLEYIYCSLKKVFKVETRAASIKTLYIIWNNYVKRSVWWYVNVYTKIQTYLKLKKLYVWFYWR